MSVSSFNDLVGEREQIRWNFEAERLRLVGDAAEHNFPPVPSDGKG
jgi:hypothetical protein